MSLHRLAVEPRDVAAEALGLLLGAAAPTTLAELRICDDDDGALVLGLLGASHVVTATACGRHLTEQVSCDALAGGGQQLPRRHTTDGYTLQSTTTALPRLRVDALAAELRSRADTDASWICGAFPGADSAVTALTGAAVPGGGWSWQTWHLYPGADTGVVVTTSSRWQP